MGQVLGARAGYPLILHGPYSQGRYPLLSLARITAPPNHGLHFLGCHRVK